MGRLVPHTQQPKMDFKTILNKLYEGSRLTIPFDNIKDREAFRQRLYKAKQEQDKVLTDILDEDRQTLRCQLLDTVEVSEESITSEVIKAKFWLEKKPSQEFAVEIEETANEKATLPGSMGNNPSDAGEISKDKS